MATMNRSGKLGLRAGGVALLLAAASIGLAAAAPASNERDAGECSSGSLFSQPWAVPFMFYTNRVANLDGSSGVYLENFAGLTGPICGLQWWGSASRYAHACGCWFSPFPDDHRSVGVYESVPLPIRFRLDFYEDVAGVPGALRASRLVTPVAVRAGSDWEANSCPHWDSEGCPPDPIVNWMYTARLEPGIDMTKGWISIRALISSPDTHSYWSTATSGMDEVICYRQDGNCEFRSGRLSLCLMGAETPLPVTIQVWMPQLYYRPGDSFRLTARTTSNLAGPVDCNLCVVLDLHGAYYFYPSWSPMGALPDSQPVTVEDDNRMLIDSFAWPAGLAPDAGLRFWGACLDPALSGPVSNLAWIDWGHGS